MRGRCWDLELTDRQEKRRADEANDDDLFVEGRGQQRITHRPHIVLLCRVQAKEDWDGCWLGCSEMSREGG